MYANNAILSLACKGWGVSLLQAEVVEPQRYFCRLREVVVADQELVVAF